MIPNDLPGYLLDKVYNHMTEEEMRNFSMDEAEKIAHDLGLDGIEVDPVDVYELIREFIQQDKE